MDLTLLFVLMSVLGSALSYQPSSSNQHGLEPNQVVAGYLAESAREVHFYRKEMRRELDLLSHLSDSIRSDAAQHATSANSERLLILSGLIDRLASTYEHLDQTVEIFVPEESELAKASGDDDVFEENTDNSESRPRKRFLINHIITK